MLTFVFLFAIAIMAVAGIFIAIQAKRRSAAQKVNAASVRNGMPAIERATPDND